jgi:hypothetical protein
MRSHRLAFGPQRDFQFWAAQPRAKSWQYFTPGTWPFDADKMLLPALICRFKPGEILPFGITRIRFGTMPFTTACGNKIGANRSTPGELVTYLQLSGENGRGG